jgi:hypothetical protein
MNDKQVVEKAREGAVVRVSVEAAPIEPIEEEVSYTSSVGDSHIIHLGPTATEETVAYLVHAAVGLSRVKLYQVREDDSMNQVGRIENVELIEQAPESSRDSSTDSDESSFDEGPEGPRGAV